MDTTIKKPDPKSLCYLAIVLIVALFVFAGLWYYLSRAPKIEEVEERPTERTLEEIIKNLTAPQGEAEPLSEEVIEGLTTPQKGAKPVPLSEEIIKNLTTPK